MENDLTSVYETVKAGLSSAVDTVQAGAQKVSAGYNAVTSSAGKAYLRQFVDKDEWGADMLNQEETASLKELVLDRVGNRGSGISYKHYDEAGGKGIGYGMATPITELANPRSSLKMTLGKANIVRDGDNIYVADTYDFSGKVSQYADAPILEKLDVLYDMFTDDRVSTYGKMHAAAELFGANEGNGIPVRIKVGSLEELGLTPDDVDYLEEMSSFNSRVKDNRSQKKDAPTRRSRERKAAQVVDDVVVDTSTAFKRYGVVGGDSTLEALRAATGDKTLSWNATFIGSDGKTYSTGSRIPRGIKLRIVR